MSQVCTQCHTEGEPKKAKRGYAAVTWVFLGLFVLVVGLQFFDHYAEVDSLRTSSFRAAAEQRYETPVGLRVLGVVAFWGWLAHVVMRAVTKRLICPACMAGNTMVPASSPKGRALIDGGGPSEAIEKRANASEQTKNCPACAELVKAEATKCRFCGEALAA